MMENGVLILLLLGMMALI